MNRGPRALGRARGAAWALLLAVPALAGCLSGPLGAPEPAAERDAAPGPAAAQLAWEAAMPWGVPSIRASPDGSVVAVATSLYREGVTLRAFAAAGGERLLEHRYEYQICCYFPPLALSERGERVLAPGENVSLLDRNGSVLRVVDLPHDSPGSEYPELPVFAQLSRNGSVAAWSTWQPGRLYVQRSLGEPWVVELGTGSAFPAVALSRDGAWVAVATPQRVFLFDSGSPEAVQAWSLGDPEGAYYLLQDVALSDNASLLAAFRFEARSLSLLLLRPGLEEPVAEVPLGPGGWGIARMAPDGTWVAAGAALKRARLFDASGKEIADFGPGSQVVDALRIGGEDLLLVYRDGAVLLYEVDARGAWLRESAATEAPAFQHALLRDGFAALAWGTSDEPATLKRYAWA